MGNTTHAYSHTRTFLDPGPLSAQLQINPGALQSRQPHPSLTHSQGPLGRAGGARRPGTGTQAVPPHWMLTHGLRSSNPRVPVSLLPGRDTRYLETVSNSNARVPLSSHVQPITGVIRTRGTSKTPLGPRLLPISPLFRLRQCQSCLRTSDLLLPAPGGLSPFPQGRPTHRLRCESLVTRHFLREVFSAFCNSLALPPSPCPRVYPVSLLYWSVGHLSEMT